MRKLTIVATLGAAALVATVGLTGTATAGNLIGSLGIRDGSIRSVDIHDGTIKTQDLKQSTIDALRAPAGSTPTVAQAPAQGLKGDRGEKGDNGLKGAYYAVANYDVGDTNAGAVASVACSAQTDVAISGGVQVTGLDPANPVAHNAPVSSSFPGRMDWSTNTPKPGRLDGWIVQFGGSNDNPPLKTKIWALCVPGATVPVVTTYTESN